MSDLYEPEHEEIPIEEFDDLARRKMFEVGPYLSTFGDGYGDPYITERTVIGILNGGRKVRATKKVK